jgi:DNA primase
MDFMKKLNIADNLLESAGVVVKKEKGRYDKFRNRLIFPILNRNGKVIAFQGRTLGDDLPKYLNSPDTKIFLKGNTLFNFYYARKAIHEKGFAVLVEGNMDALSLSINGIENVVAPMGTSVTINQVKELLNYTDEICVCFDGDTAGQKAMIRLSQLVLPLMKIGKKIKFIILPKNLDPDDFVLKYGKYDFLDLIKNAISLSDYIWQYESENLNLEIPENRALLEKNINILLTTIEDTKLKTHFEKFYRDKFWNINRRTKKKELMIKTLDLKNNVDIDLVEQKEKEICERLVKFPSIINKLHEKYGIDIFELEFYTERCILAMEALDEFMNKDSNLQTLLQDKKIDKYLKINKDWTEEKSLEVVNILILKRNKDLLRFDLENETENIRIKIIGDEIGKIQEKIDEYCIKYDIV